LMFTTKETAFISVGTLGLAWLTAELWERVRGGPRGQRARAAAEPEGGFAKLRQDGKAGIAILGAVALFMLIWVAFYSSFFTHWQGVFWDSFRAFAVWRKTGMSEFHSKPFYTYIKWLMQEDVAILVLGTLGALVALFERRLNRFAVFAAAWGFGLLAAYSLISYKTPWLVLSFLVPLAVVGGYAVQAFSRVRRSRLIVVLLSIAVGAYLLLNSGEMLRNIYAVVSGTDTHVTATFGDILPLLLGFIVLLATFVLSAMWAKHQWRGWPWQASAALAAVVVVVSLYQTLVVNFVEYDNDQYPYVYSQTRREFVDLVREIERVGERAGTKEPGFATASPEYWPSPWYFRNNSHAGYEGRLSSYYDPKSTLAIIGREDQLPQLERVAGDTYTRVGGLYPLRPGVNLVLFVRRDLTPK
jgi:uncharacterized protein (TIGR03663 family)